MKTIRIYRALPIVLFLVAFFGCTDLEEDVLDESLTGTGQAEIVSGSIAPVYGLLRNVWLHTRNFGLQEIASDEAIIPNRGGRDWFDGGKFIAVHQHLMTPGNSLVGDSWNEITLSISRAVIAIDRLRPEADNGNAEAQGALHEMIAARAYLNMLALDNWGIVFKKESSEEISQILRAQEAVDYIESELLSVVEVINNDQGPGRFTKDAVKALLARLYLNSAVYRDPYGTPNFLDADMDKVIQYTNDIISGPYSLSPEYFDIFNDDNNSNPEVIFSLDQRGVLQTEHSRWQYWSISGDQIPRPEFPNTRGTDAAAATPDFIQTWADAYGNVDAAVADARFFQENTVIPENLRDLTGVNPNNDADHFYCVPAEEFEIDRGILRGIIWGPRKDEQGNILTCDDGSVRIYPVINRRTSGADLKYVDHNLDVNFTDEGSLHNTGHRFSKYQFSRTAPNCCSNSSVDIVLLRLGEIYLMRAEAKLRKGDNAGALADINTLRTSRTARPEQTPEALATIDLDILFRESGFELYWEGLRRTYQIRFGKYEGSWTGKTDSDPNKRLFPIPQRAIDGASSVEGFLVQNPGY
ncbi:MULTISPECIES: RagB/SusD family nutrient uptake outer membrane protein [Maribacter]|uniref:RagB/SusD family nutrient uptake outer membrane protein n=1 Tax=Maribacter flavus TaxID=1658664 RepID=A0ABU7IDT0_9FLAO|nr:MULTISPECIES: RagB/SusD family nutrient uptake outer membrane protein [Maribacter]MDC6403767.1 RagB/SusD family nutrient uptake outer membrane protein [Maribacter sp. PR66]MEE1970908.1 RagB/SusD family nutrient uptake outer membrane protein [Maribacter flavus]